MLFLLISGEIKRIKSEKIRDETKYFVNSGRKEKEIKIRNRINEIIKPTGLLALNSSFSTILKYSFNPIKAIRKKKKINVNLLINKHEIRLTTYTEPVMIRKLRLFIFLIN